MKRSPAGYVVLTVPVEVPLPGEMHWPPGEVGCSAARAYALNVVREMNSKWLSERYEPGVLETCIRGERKN